MVRRGWCRRVGRLVCGRARRGPIPAGGTKASGVPKMFRLSVLSKGIGVLRGGSKVRGDTLGVDHAWSLQHLPIRSSKYWRHLADHPSHSIHSLYWNPQEPFSSDVGPFLRFVYVSLDHFFFLFLLRALDYFHYASASGLCIIFRYVSRLLPDWKLLRCAPASALYDIPFPFTIISPSRKKTL